MGKYFTPPDTVDFGAIGGLLGLGATIIAIIGVLILLGTIVYTIVQTIKMFTAKGASQWAFKNIMIALCIGLVLTGSGWFGIIKSGNQMLVSPIRTIFEQEQD